MQANWIVIGAVMGLVGVGLGAFGAHGIEGSVTAEELGWWHTATQYHLIHAPVIVLFGLLRRNDPTKQTLPPLVVVPDLDDHQSISMLI